MENFVEAGDVHVGEILTEVMGACLVDGAVHDVVHGADGQIDAEKIAAKFVDAAIGAVADQGQAEGDLLEPIFADWQMEEHLVVGSGGGEGVSKSGLSAVGLLIDKLAADVGLLGQAGDGEVSGESLDAEGESFAGAECFGGAVIGNGLLQSAGSGNRMAHVCFLRERLAMLEPPVWGKQTFQKTPT